MYVTELVLVCAIPAKTESKSGGNCRVITRDLRRYLQIYDQRILVAHFIKENWCGLAWFRGKIRTKPQLSYEILNSSILFAHYSIAHQ